jgi:prolyl oligopeptidase
LTQVAIVEHSGQDRERVDLRRRRTHPCSRIVYLEYMLAVLLLMSFAQPASYPETKKVDQIDDYHGTKVSDPYRWLEDLDSEETRAWVKRQQAHTEAWFAGAPDRKQWLGRMDRLWNFEQMPLTPDGTAGIIVRGGRIFLQRQGGGDNQPILYVQDSEKAKPRVLLDPNKMSKDGTVALSTWQPSPDGKWIVYGIAQAGSDWQTWHVRSAETGKDTTDKVEWIKFAAPAWDADSKGFYYSRYPKPEGNTLTGVNEFHQVWHHRLGAPQSADRKIYERPDQKDWLLSPTVTEDGRYLVITVFKGTLAQTLVFYQDLHAKDGKTHELISEFYALQNFLGNRGSRFHLHTTWQAPKGRVVEIDLAKPDRNEWKELVGESPYTLSAGQMEGDRIALQYLKDATGLARIYSIADANVRDVPLPANSKVTLADRSARYFSVSSFTAPEIVYDCGKNPGQCEPALDVKLPFDESALTSKQVFYKSKDGTKVPMFLVHRKDLKLDGTNPTLLFGYGGFDVSISPAFSPRFLAFVERGGVVAVANLRGGGEYGQEWHEAGMKDKKQNVFDDFIAAAEHLIAEKYTSSKKLAISGGSNGGLLVAACMNQRPDLFGAAVPAVGVMDMLRFYKFTIGAAWTMEYGSPDNPEDFPVLYRYSPLHNIKPGTSYPATLILTADHDDRVVPSHSFKYAAALQKAQAGEAPILIRIQTSAGHGAGKPKTIKIAEDADVLTFLWKVLGAK